MSGGACSTKKLHDLHEQEGAGFGARDLFRLEQCELRGDDGRASMSGFDRDHGRIGRCKSSDALRDIANGRCRIDRHFSCSLQNFR